MSDVRTVEGHPIRGALPRRDARLRAHRPGVGYVQAGQGGHREVRRLRGRSLSTTRSRRTWSEDAQVLKDAQEVAYQRAGESGISATKPVADDHRDVRVVKKTPVVFKVDSGELARKLDEVWPVDEETGEELPAADVPRPALIQEARVVLQQLLGSFVPTAVTSKLVDLYVAVRREYDSQVRLLDSRAGIDDERRPSMRERFDDERRQSASETLSEAAPYEWGRTSLELS